MSVVPPIKTANTELNSTNEEKTDKSIINQEQQADCNKRVAKQIEKEKPKDVTSVVLTENVKRRGRKREKDDKYFEKAINKI